MYIGTIVLLCIANVNTNPNPNPNTNPKPKPCTVIITELGSFWQISVYIYAIVHCCMFYLD